MPQCVQTPKPWKSPTPTPRAVRHFDCRVTFWEHMLCQKRMAVIIPTFEPVLKQAITLQQHKAFYEEGRKLARTLAGERGAGRDGGQGGGEWQAPYPAQRASECACVCTLLEWAPTAPARARAVGSLPDASR